MKKAIQIRPTPLYVFCVLTIKMNFVAWFVNSSEIVGECYTTFSFIYISTYTTMTTHTKSQESKATELLTEFQALGAARLQQKSDDSDEREKKTRNDEVYDVVERLATKMKCESNPRKTEYISSYCTRVSYLTVTCTHTHTTV